MATRTKSDEDAPKAVDTTAIAASAAADAGVRPIDSPARRATDPNARRASARGVYRDREGDRRVVGAGDVVPDGWELIEETDLDGRASGTPTAQDEPGTDGGGTPPAE